MNLPIKLDLDKSTFYIENMDFIESVLLNRKKGIDELLTGPDT